MRALRAIVVTDETNRSTQKHHKQQRDRAESREPNQSTIPHSRDEQRWVPETQSRVVEERKSAAMA
jgi:hypothetical protein